jgi:hypothetical protein
VQQHVESTHAVPRRGESHAQWRTNISRAAGYQDRV